MKNILKTFLISGVITSLAFTMACGKSTSVENRKDVSNVLSSLVGSMSALGTAASGKRLKQVVAQLQADRAIHENRSWLNIPDCPKLPTNEAGCTLTCKGGLMTVSCDGTAKQTYTCAGTTYTLANARATVTVDMSSVDITSAGGVTGSLAIGLDVSASLSGGAITEAKEFSCKFSETVTFENDGSINGAYTPDCDDFACSFDGTNISCDDMKTELSTNSCSSSNNSKIGTGTIGSGTDSNDSTDSDSESDSDDDSIPSDSNPGDSDNTQCSCDMSSTSNKMCTEYVGLFYASACNAYIKGNCTGTYSESACPTAGLVGSCRISSDTNSEYLMRYYDANMANSAREWCYDWVSN